MEPTATRTGSDQFVFGQSAGPHQRTGFARYALQIRDGHLNASVARRRQPEPRRRLRPHGIEGEVRRDHRHVQRQTAVRLDAAAARQICRWWQQEQAPAQDARPPPSPPPPALARRQRRTGRTPVGLRQSRPSGQRTAGFALSNAIGTQFPAPNVPPFPHWTQRSAVARPVHRPAAQHAPTGDFKVSTFDLIHSDDEFIAMSIDGNVDVRHGSVAPVHTTIDDASVVVARRQSGQSVRHGTRRRWWRRRWRRSRTPPPPPSPPQRLPSGGALPGRRPIDAGHGGGIDSRIRSVGQRRRLLAGRALFLR